jgi:AcrR family transcriptional regulator
MVNWIILKKKSTNTRPAYHHGDLRQQLLNAVRTLVDEKGAENFSIAEAARVAGVSSAAPYRHFQDKPEILRALVLEELQAMSVRMQSVMQPHTPGSIERIEALGFSYIDYAKQHPGLFRLIFGISESHEGDAELEEKGQGVFAILIAAVADYLGIDAHDEEATRIAYLLWTVVHGHSWLTIDCKASKAGIELNEADLLGTISDRLLRPYRRQ